MAWSQRESGEGQGTPPSRLQGVEGEQGLWDETGLPGDRLAGQEAQGRTHCCTSRLC